MADVLFVAGGNMTIAGARLRAYWPAAHIPGANITNWVAVRDGGLPDAAAVVFQKLIDIGAARRARDKGAAVFWDVCDPAWWWNAADVREALDVVTAVVASNGGLADDLRDWADDDTPVHVIADRMELAHYRQQRQHGYGRPVRLIWFGSSQNRAALYTAHVALSRLQANDYSVALTVCDNAPHAPMREIEGDYPIYYTRWALETEVATLTAHDIALLPPYPGPWGKVKSNNKALTAAACGLPTATGESYAALRELVADVALRQDAGMMARREVEAYWRVEQSAAEWQALIAQYLDEVKHDRNGTVPREAALQV